jgi:hypothetical protein
MGYLKRGIVKVKWRDEELEMEALSDGDDI